MPSTWNKRAQGADEWREVVLWFKQHLEESLGKTPGRLMKLVLGLEEPTSTTDQLVLIIRVCGLSNVSPETSARLSADGYDVRELNLNREEDQLAAGAPYELPRLFQIFTIVKYRLAELWDVCAVNQPPVEYYKRVVAFLERDDGVGKVSAEKYLAEEPLHTLTQNIGACDISINYHASAVNGSLPSDEVAGEVSTLGLNASSIGDVLGCIHRVALRRTQADHQQQCYGEYIYFGNLTRGEQAHLLRNLLQEEGAGSVWSKAAHSFGEVGKGPGVGHATHAMGKQGGVLTLSIVPATHRAAGGYCSDYPTGYQTHNAYANVFALAGYDVVAGSQDQEEHLEGGHGHAGMVVLMQIPSNDDATRSALAQILVRVAEVVRL